MKIVKSIVPVALLSLAIGVPTFAQTSSPSASDSMNQAGQDVKAAGSDTVNAAKNVGEGTATAIKDTTITAKVKKSLHGDEATKSQKIHVSTSAGVVTLKGNVASQATAARAVELAQGTKGVKSVDNQLAVSGTM